jgi:hypothetical protein
MFLGGNLSHNLSSAIAAFMFVKSLLTSRISIERTVPLNRYLIGFLSGLEFEVSRVSLLFGLQTPRFIPFLLYLHLIVLYIRLSL